MDAADDLLRRIGTDRELSGFLAWPGDFDLGRRDPVEELRLPTGMPLAPIAGDGAGGTFFLCGEPGTARPVLYADSEGGAALIGADLAEALALITAHPYWRDLGNGHSPAELEAELIEDDPGYPARRDRALALLGVVPPTADEALARLRACAARTVPDFQPIARHREGAGPYDSVYSVLFQD